MPPALTLRATQRQRHASATLLLHAMAFTIIIALRERSKCRNRHNHTTIISCRIIIMMSCVDTYAAMSAMPYAICNATSASRAIRRHAPKMFVTPPSGLCYARASQHGARCYRRALPRAPRRARSVCASSPPRRCHATLTSPPPRHAMSRTHAQDAAACHASLRARCCRYTAAARRVVVMLCAAPRLRFACPGCHAARALRDSVSTHNVGALTDMLTPWRERLSR